MTCLRLIYVSRPLDFDAVTLSDILTTSHYCNNCNDVTGALIARADLYLQLLEGPEEAVDQTYARIRQDPRHTGVRLLVRRETQWRLFPGWTMRAAPGESWMWSPEQVAAGVPARAPRPEVEAIFVRLWREGRSLTLPGAKSRRRNPR